MRIRGVWTTNLTAFLLGAGLYSSFVVFPQFAQLPKSTGFGFGASVVVSGLYLLPSTIGMVIVGSLTGRITARFGSRHAVIVGSAFTAAAFGLIAVAHELPAAHAAQRGVDGGRHRPRVRGARQSDRRRPSDPHQTGAAGGMNTVMRTIGGAIGGQLSATFIAGHLAATAARGHRLHRNVRDGDRVPGRLHPGGASRARTAHRACAARAGAGDCARARRLVRGSRAWRA